MKGKGATLCTGIRAPEVAMPYIDWVYSAEIEPFPCDVISHYAPGVPNLGDITAPDFIPRAKALGPLDVLVAGTPCQAFSVAGLRRSLDDDRGNLTLRFVEIVDAIQPRSILWENVPGVLSSHDNAFGCFLAAMVGADSPLVPPKGLKWTDSGLVIGPSRIAAWRIVDAQWFGLAQRRERVLVVSCPRDGAHPGKILLIEEGVSRYPPARKEAGKDVTGTLSARTQGGGGLGTDFDLDGGLVAQAIPIHQPDASDRDSNRDGSGIGEPGDPFFTLRDRPRDAVAVAFCERGRDGGRNVEVQEDLAYCLTNPASGGRTHSRQILTPAMAVRRLTVIECARLQGFPDLYLHRVPAKPRKISADEAEYLRSHGLPVWLGDVPEKRITRFKVWRRVEGKREPFHLKRTKPRIIPAHQAWFTSVPADGPMYKALGNSMAVNCISWVGKRIAEALGVDHA